jgi:hypothetical protein
VQPCCFQQSRDRRSSAAPLPQFSSAIRKISALPAPRALRTMGAATRGWGNCMMRFTALSAAALALAVAVPLGTEAEATPISDQMAADMYKQCYDYCLGGESEDFCRSSCTCSVRLTEKQITVEEATALGNGTASPEVQARLAAITRQCSN